MYTAFVKLLNMSAAGAVLIGAVVVLRFVLGRVPKKYICLLWALAALRLICPVSFSAPTSAFNYLAAPMQSSGQVEYVQYNGKSEKPMAGVQVAVPSVVGGEKNVSVSGDVYIPTILGLWAAGLTGMLGYGLISGGKLRRQVRESARLTGNIFVCDRIPTPFILGIFLPRIYLPSNLEKVQMRSIISHERAHIARHDHWWKPLGYAILCVHWFNPLVWLGYILFCRDMEMACDEKVIAPMNPSQRKEYAAVLLSCSLPRHRIDPCPLAFGESDVVGRIRGIAKFRKPTLWAGSLACLAVLVLILGFVSNPMPSGDWIRLRSRTSRPNEPTVSQFRLRTGERVKNAEVSVELWRNGVCEEYIPLSLPEAVTDLTVSMAGIPDGDSLRAYRVQIDSAPGDAALTAEIPLPEGSVLLDSYAWRGPKDVPLNFRTEVLLGAAILDDGGGFMIFDFDNGDYGTYGSRLRSQNCVVLVRASFQSMDDTGISRLLRYNAPAWVELWNDSTLGEWAPAGMMDLDGLAVGGSKWKIETELSGVTGHGEIRRGIKLCREDGSMLVFRSDSDAVCEFNINGDCIARYTSRFTGEEMVELLWNWAASQMGVKISQVNTLTLNQMETPHQLNILLRPTDAVTIDGWGAVCPEEQETWTAAWDAVMAAGEPGTADGSTFYGAYIHYRDDYLELHRDDRGLFLRKMGADEIWSPENAKPLLDLLEPVLSAFRHDPVKPADLRGIRYANLVLDGMQYTLPIGDPGVKELEAILTSAEPMGYLGACVFGSQLTVTLEDGTFKTVSVATDSCGTYLSDGVCYEFPGDNAQLYGLFGVEWGNGEG